MKLLSLLALLLLVSCTDPKGTTELLESKGYTNIQITGYKPFSCWKNEIATGFIATNKDNEIDTGCVCSNFFSKRITVKKKK